MHCRSDINTTQILRTSRMVSKYTGIAVQANKAIVGANAFAHESGIHQHGVLKHANTYEIMTPESVGIVEEEKRTLVLGKHSGKAAYRQRLIELGYADIAADAEQLNKIVEGAKAVADKKKVSLTPSPSLSLEGARGGRPLSHSRTRSSRAPWPRCSRTPT